MGLMLVAIGMAGALLRDRQRRRQSQSAVALPARPVDVATTVESKAEVLTADIPNVFDDVGELHHYQRVSWYALAFSASGTWFYPPATLVSVPLLGYNAYHFLKTIRHSDKSERRSPMTVFEVIAITGTLVTGRPAMASALMLFSFGTRKLLLQAGNIANNIDFTRAVNPRQAKVWILREGVELETSVVDLQAGDVVVLHAGDTVFVKGRIVEGSGEVRQFSLNKQMKLIDKQQGDQVFPFTRLESGCLFVHPL